jgi:hypothetical protein
VRKLAPSDGWQTTAEAVARRVVEEEQEDAVEDEEVVQEEDLSDEEADSAGPVKWYRRARYWQWKEGGGGQGQRDLLGAGRSGKRPDGPAGCGARCGEDAAWRELSIHTAVPCGITVGL